MKNIFKLALMKFFYFICTRVQSHAEEVTKLQADFERQTQEIIAKYEKKMKDLRYASHILILLIIIISSIIYKYYTCILCLFLKLWS